MRNYLKLPFQFDAALLKQDLEKVADDEWIKHFNQYNYEGNWSVVSLRSGQAVSIANALVSKFVTFIRPTTDVFVRSRRRKVQTLV